MSVSIIIVSITAIIGLVFLLRKKLVKYLLMLKGKLHIQSLRNAIKQADKDKDATGRKNMVVFNTASGEFEAVQKKQLKRLATAKKQEPVKRGYRIKKAKKRISINHETIHKVEKKSLYVTR